MTPENDQGQRADQPTDTDQNTDQDTTKGTTKDRLTVNKLLVRHVAEALVNDGNLTVVQDHSGLTNAVGRHRWLLTALPDARISIEWQVAEGDWVVTGATVRGTHLGEWEGLSPTGKPVTLQTIVRYPVVDGKIVHNEVFMDLLAALEQVGAQRELRPRV